MNMTQRRYRHYGRQVMMPLTRFAMHAKPACLGGPATARAALH
jgi:hypothetical protein